MSLDKKTILELLVTQSLSTIIIEGRFNPLIKMPIKPSRPILSRVHTSDQALSYATVLANHEKDTEQYHAQLKVYRGNQAKAATLFKWACFYDIRPGLANDERPKYLAAREIAWNMAWERGHSEGLHSVYQELIELNELLLCI